MSIKELLKVPLFSEINKEVLLPLLKERQIYASNYKKGVTVHEQSKSCKTLDVVLSGSLVAYSLSQNGSETVMFEFTTGGIIGANLLFSDNGVYPLNIYCLTDCRLLHMTKDAVLELLKNHDFVMRYIKSLSQNSQGMNHKIAMFTQKSLRENIMDYLTAQISKQQSTTIILPVTKKQLADYFGVQRPSLFRELKKLVEEGIITINNREITVKTYQHKHYGASRNKEPAP